MYPYDLSGMQLDYQAFAPNELANYNIPQNLGGLEMMGQFQQGVPQNPQQAANLVAPQDNQAMSKMDVYRMMAQGIQGMGKGMQQQMPSANTAQIIRDQNQFRFAGTPQQQMAQALRKRG